MQRAEKIEWLINAIIMIEGVNVEPEYFSTWSDAQLDDEMDWMEYLLTK